MYIEPNHQLPERAESLHPSVDWQAIGEQLAQGFRVIGEAFAEVVKQVAPAFQILGEAIEEATRENAYRPQGPVIRSTGFGLPDNIPPIGQKLIEPPYVCMHEGKAVFTNFGTIEQIVERLQKQRKGKR